MARLFRVFPVKLRPGVTADEFERFLKEDWVEVFSSAPGVRSYVLKGNQGVEVGRYRLVIEFDRVETRDLYWPPGAVESEVWKQVSAKGMSAPEAIRAEDRWAALVPPDWVEDYTGLAGCRVRAAATAMCASAECERQPRSRRCAATLGRGCARQRYPPFHQPAMTPPPDPSGSATATGPTLRHCRWQTCVAN